MKLAFQLSPSLIPNLTLAFFEECDLELARHSLPADLKLMEGLLKNDPENRQILTSLCMGFTGYAMLFVEDSDPERASQLYLRARAYGLRSLGLNPPSSCSQGKKRGAAQSQLQTIGVRDIESLFWTALSWNLWINLSLDKPDALAQLGTAQAYLERVLEIKPDYFYGSAYVLMGSMLAARPRILGGDEALARQYFERAMDLSGGRFFMVQYFFARYYAVRVQDKQLFLRLLAEIDTGPPDRLKEACLINAAMKQKAKQLKKISEELFF
jgi:tetratricopeptide (TPR) repeat protein